MKSKLPLLLTALAVLTGSAACGTLGKHYGEDDYVLSAPVPSRSNERTTAVAYPTAQMLVDSLPSGAIIRFNGIRIGPGPVVARPEIDAGGNLVMDITISADYSVFALTRNATEIITARYRAGDLPPRRVTLARGVDGGILSLGGSAPSAD
jgi:hypothetical protein